MEPSRDGANATASELALQNRPNASAQFTGVQLIQSFKPLIIPCYALVVLVGIFGNYLLLYVICKSKKMHNVTNFFIGNLAFSDMLMCATCVPFTLAYAFNPQGWVFGRFLCYFVFLMQPMTVYVSVFTLTAIAVDGHPQRPHPVHAAASGFAPNDGFGTSPPAGAQLCCSSAVY